MYGAIIGDIIGSVYELHNIANIRTKNFHKTKDFPLFSKESTFTDDTYCTVAVAEFLLLRKHPVEYCLRKWAKHYSSIGGGKSFIDWVNNESAGPYNSFGNGAAMRIFCRQLPEQSPRRVSVFPTILWNKQKKRLSPEIKLVMDNFYNHSASPAISRSSGMGSRISSGLQR